MGRRGALLSKSVARGVMYMLRGTGSTGGRCRIFEVVRLWQGARPIGIQPPLVSRSHPGRTVRPMLAAGEFGSTMAGAMQAAGK